MRVGGVIVGLLALLAAAPITAAPRPEMNVAIFLAKADRLQANGMMSVASSDYRLLKAEVERAADIYLADIRRARAAKRVPHSCPPETTDLTPDDLLNFMRRIPPAKRPMTTVRSAIYGLMLKRYPCRVPLRR